MQNLRPHSLPLLAFLAAFLFVFRQFVLLDASGAPGLIIRWDFDSAFYPWLVYTSDVIRAGAWPFWCPYVGAGTPFFINPVNPLYSPLTWLVSLTVGYTHYVAQLQSIALLALTGLGAYVLAFALWRSRAAALTTALAFGLSSAVYGNLQHSSILYVYAGMPWLFWLLYRLMAEGRRGAALGLTGLLYMAAVTAYPTFVVQVLAWGACWTVFLLARCVKDPAERLRRLGHGLLAGVFALGLSAVHWLPILSYRDEFTRGQPLSPEAALANGLDYAHAWGTIFNFFTTTSFAGDPLDVAMRGIYFGAIAWPLVAIAVLRRRDAWTAALVALAGGALMMAMGSHFFFRVWVHHLLPVLNFSRFPAGDSRTLMVLGLTLLAGRGMQVLLTGDRTARRLGVAGLAVLLAVLALGFVFLPGLVGPTAFQAGPRGFLLLQIGVTAAALVAVALAGRVGPSPTRLGVLALLALDLGLAFRANVQVAGETPRDYAAKRALHRHEFRAEEALKPRGYGCSASIVEDASCEPANVGMLTKTFYLGQYNPLKLRRLHHLVEVGLQPWLLTGPRVVLWPAEALPASAAAFLKGSRTVPFELPTYGPNDVTYRLHVDRPGWLVFNEVYVPGWLARVDGAGMPMVPALEGLRALPIAPGDHLITTTFAPGVFRTALGLSLASLALAAAWFGWLWRRRAFPLSKRATPPVSPPVSGGVGR